MVMWYGTLCLVEVTAGHRRKSPKCRNLSCNDTDFQTCQQGLGLLKPSLKEVLTNCKG